MGSPIYDAVYSETYADLLIEPDVYGEESGVTTVAGSFTADAVLKRNIAGSFTADAVLKRIDQPGSFTADAVVSSTETHEASFTADAVLFKTITGSFTGDAVLKKTFSGSLTGDAVLRRSVSGSFTADAVLKKIVSGTLTADAVQKKTISGSFTADAIERKTQTGSFAADAVFGSPTGSFTADAITKRTYAKNFTADALLLAHSFTASAYIVVPAPGEPGGPPLGTKIPAVIKVNGVDITDDVMIAGATFTQAVNARPGSFSFEVKDDDHIYNFVSGGRVTLDIDNRRAFDGYLDKATLRYAFSVDLVEVPDETPRIWRLEGPDLNILFTKRVIFDQVNPNADLPTYAAGTTDVSIIRDFMLHYIDLTNDEITYDGITHVGSPNPDADGYIIPIGSSWGEAMSAIGQLPGAVWGLSQDRDLFYEDDSTENAPFALSDTPSGPATLSDHFTRTVAGSWGGGWSSDGGDGTPYVDGAHGAIPAHTYTLQKYDSLPTLTDFDFYMNFKTEPIGTGQNWSSYLYSELGSSWFDLYPDSYPTASPYDLGVEVGGNSSGGDITLLSVVADAWYSIHWRQLGSTTYLRVWPQGDAEPGTWLLTHAIGTPVPYFFIDLEGGYSAPSLIDNILIYGEVDRPEAFGYRDFSWTDDGTRLVNDAQVWGAGTGSPTPVYSETIDATSVTEHGRWQLPGQFRGDMFRQATVDNAADSIVYGSPQNLHGGKDPAIVVLCSVKKHGLRAGMKVRFINTVHNLDKVLPIRRLTITFVTVYDIMYSLELTQEIDSPWFFAEFAWPKFPPFQKPPKLPRPRPPRWVIRDPGGCSDTICLIDVIEDDFQRSVAPGGWGTSSSGDVWNTLSGGPRLSVDGTAGLMTLVGGQGAQVYLDEATAPWTYPIYTSTMRFSPSTAPIAAVFPNPAKTTDITFDRYTFVQMAGVDGPPITGVPKSYIQTGVEGNVTFIPFTFWTAGGNYTLTESVSGSTIIATVSDSVDSYSVSGTISERVSAFIVRTDYFAGITDTQVVSYDDLSFTYDRCSQIQFDNFDRISGPNSWGTATPDGSGWSTSDTYEPYVDDGVGVIGIGPLTSDNGEVDLLTPPSYLWAGVIAGAPTVTMATAFKISGDVTDSSSQNELRFQFWNGAAQLTFIINQTPGNGFIILGDNNAGPVADVAFTDWEADVWYYVRWEQTWGGLGQAKIWRAGTTEPDWMLSATLNTSFTNNYFVIQANSAGGPGPIMDFLFDFLDFDYVGRPCYVGGDPPSDSVAQGPLTGAYGCETAVRVSSTVYNTSFIYVSGTTTVYLAGRLMRPTYDYTEQPTDRTITFILPVDEADPVWVCYTAGAG